VQFMVLRKDRKPNHVSMGSTMVFGKIS